MTFRLLITMLFATFLLASPALAKTAQYELVAKQEKVNLSGKKTVDFALTVNGGIPAPTLEFTEGDDAVIVVKNQIPDQDLSIHWHGILLPPEMDGVPYVNTPPIKPGTSHTFRFKIRQNGTYWYHSHTDVQEQKGVYGAIIIHPKNPTIKADKDVVVVLSDWSDENALQILANLRKDGDYYLYKKDTIRSWWGAFQAGGLGTYLNNEWTRMGGMDFSDVGYDAFLTNGKKEAQLADAKPGETVRLRIINAAASSYFYVALGDTLMTVISADGIDITPTQAKEILIGMAETYDVLFKVPKDKSYELRATVQDGTGSTSGWIGTGQKVPAPVKPFPDMYAGMDHAAMGHASMDHGAMDQSASDQPPVDHSKMDHSKMDHSKMDHSKMDHSKMDPSKIGHAASVGAEGQTVDSLTVDKIKAVQKTTLPTNVPVNDVKLVLNGDMERYIWHINGKAIHEDRNIVIKEGDVVRFTFENKTMMHHPMHLHGHFFRVLNGQGDFSPLKHTVDVPPHATRTIEFYANEPGEWMLHCHNLYHMKTGMARVVKYMSYKPSPEIAAIQKDDPHNHDHWYSYGMLEGSTNHFEGRFRLSQTWNDFEARGEARKEGGKWHGEGDLFYRRWFDQYTNLILGASGFDEKYVGVVGVGQLLPLLIEANLLVDHEGKLRLDLEKRFQWTSTVFSDVDLRFRQSHESDWETPKVETETKLSLMYSPAWSWAAGLFLTDKDLGLGARVQF